MAFHHIKYIFFVFSVVTDWNKLYFQIRDPVSTNISKNHLIKVYLKISQGIKVYRRLDFGHLRTQKHRKTLSRHTELTLRIYQC